ncbi:serine hydrolase domain-containing protein [Luteimonas qiangzhengi]|uniref:serine hydrolase domain-containing protein n=1 Tax=Luteimonas sp. MJ146 TaxID=3129240 RepID=UPI0031B9E40B
MHLPLRLPTRLPTFTAALCLALTLTACVTAPDPADTGPRIGEQREATLFWSQAEREAGMRNMHLLFPSDVATHGAQVRPLPEGAPLVLDADVLNTDRLDSYMDQHHIAGLMVLQDGKVRLERYGLEFGPEQHWESYSVAKSITSTLLGIALEQGYLHDLDDPLTSYIPELAGSAYEGVTVAQLLTMTSGVRWNEDYADPQSDVARMYLGACVPGKSHALSYLRQLPREHAPGAHWSYNTAETDLIGLVVERATGQPLAHYLSDTIWKPYGMAADAYWIRDECDASNTGGSGLSATLGDYARLGQFMLEGGRINGQQVIAEAWMQGAVRGQDSEGAPERGYGYQWWTDTDGSYFAVGIFGQMLYIDPARNLVIAQLAAWPQATSSELVAARRALVEAVKQSVDAER